MSDLVRRHRFAAFNVMALLVALVLVGIWVSRRATPAHASASPGVPDPTSFPVLTVDEAAFTRVGHLRQTLGLAVTDLAAYGCSADQTSRILSALVTFDSTGVNTRAQLDADDAAAKRRVQTVARAINRGPKDGSLKGALQTALAAASASRLAKTQFDQGAVNVVLPILASSQQDLWAVVRSNIAAPPQYRFAPNLTADQLKRLMRGLRTRSVPTDGILTAAQKQAMAAAEQVKESNLDVVQQTDAAVLPDPTMVGQQQPTSGGSSAPN